MTDEELKQAAIDWINAECNTDFTLEDAPLRIRVAVERMAKILKRNPGVASESVSDLSRSFKPDELAEIEKLIRHERRLKWR